MLIDAFLFNGELDILEVRLHELGDVVDTFVILESEEYHGSANLRKLVFPQHWDRFREFLPKIHYRHLMKLEPPFDGGNSWTRENYHRNQIENVLAALNPSMQDILMLSDADEIPRAEVVGNINRSDWLYALEQDFFFYNVNTYGGNWHGTIIGRVCDFLSNGRLQDARNKRDGLPIIPNAGWHFSYFGGVPRIREKTKNFAHAHEDICKILHDRGDAEIEDDIRNMRDLYHRDMTFTRRESDDYRLPKYFLENKERFPLWTT